MPMNKYIYQLFIDNQALREKAFPGAIFLYSNNILITKPL